MLGAGADFGRVLAGVGLGLSEGDGRFDNPSVDTGNEDETSNASAAAWAHLQPDTETPRAVPAELDLASLLTSMRTTWRYTGSLTPPPCTEGLAWVVPAEPLSASVAQIAALSAIYPDNSRPLPPPGGRLLHRGSCACPDRQEALE